MWDSYIASTCTYVQVDVSCLSVACRTSAFVSTIILFSLQRKLLNICLDEKLVERLFVCCEKQAS